MTNKKDTIRLSAFTGGVNTPSSRFRLRQYVPYLSDMGIDIIEHIPYFEKSCGLPSPFKAVARIPGLVRARTSDLTWVGKEMVKGYAYLERFMKRPRIMDVDDAIWLSKPFGKFSAPTIARQMDLLVVGNDYLAEYFRSYNSNIVVLPTAIDIEKFALPRDKQYDRQGFVVGWTGLACNYKYLDMIADELENFLKKYKDATLLVVSNRPWRHRLSQSSQYRFVQWSQENEVSDLHRMDIGLMPLEDTLWSRGKCSFKMLQYMAVGLPAIVSPVGMNKDVLAKAEIGFAAEQAGQWYQALETLYNQREYCEQLGANGRKVIEQYYSAEIVGREMGQAFIKLHQNFYR